MLKKLFYVLLISAIFLFAMVFLQQNQQQVAVKFYQFAWEERLAVILVAAFCLGALVTILFGLLSSLRLRGRLYASNRKLKKAESRIQTKSAASQTASQTAS